MLERCPSSLDPRRIGCLITRSFLHTTSRLSESHRQRVARQIKVKNQEAKARRAEDILNYKAHPVLGHPLGDDSKWRQCQLAQLVITREQLEDAPLLPIQHSFGDSATVPQYQNFGIHGRDRDILFEQLPSVSSQTEVMKARRGQTTSQSKIHEEPMSWRTWNGKSPEINKADLVEQHKTHMLARLTDLRNSNADGLAFENRRRIVAFFSSPAQPLDTGRSEVQAALMTLKIRNLWSHLAQGKKDVANLRHLRRLVHQRAKILRYLKRLDFQRWERCLEQLALAPEAVEGELNIV